MEIKDTEAKKTKKVIKRKTTKFCIIITLSIAIMSAAIVYQMDVTPFGFNIDVKISSNERLKTVVDKERGLIPLGFIGSITVATVDSGLLIKEDFNWIYEAFYRSRCFKKFDFSDAKVENYTVPNDAFTVSGEDVFSTDKHPMRNLKEIYMPDNIISVGENAFGTCENLTKCDLPDGIKEIGGFAFSNCENLSIKKLPKGLTYIGESAFTNCQMLAITNLPEELSFMGRDVFSDCQNIKITELPEKIESVETQSFFLSGIEKIILNERLTYIGEKAFSYSGLLENVVFKSEIAPKIDNTAFVDLNNINIYYPNTWDVVPRALKFSHIKLIEYDVAEGVIINDKKDGDSPSLSGVKISRR